MPAIEPIRIEEAGLNALQTQRQLFYDGWLLRVSPGSAKRARSVNPFFGSTLEVNGKIAYCERFYSARELPTLFRMTPFAVPSDLDQVLERRGYIVFQPTHVQVAPLDRPPETRNESDIELAAPPIDAFVDEVARLRGSSTAQRNAHHERLASTPLVTRALIARQEGRTIGCGQAALDRDLVGIYDMVTDPACRGRGVATAIVTELLSWSWEHGATTAYLQVDAANAPAISIYRRFGFTTSYTYYYRARPNECH